MLLYICKITYLKGDVAMLAIFNDFIEQNLNCQKYQNDSDMLEVFAFLSQEDNIIKMLKASDENKPALAPVAVAIEQIFADPDRVHTNTLDDDFTKQAVGRLIKTILKPFGYVTKIQKDLPKDVSATKFASATVYRFDETEPRTMKMETVIRIVSI
jgi:hypothetical protein